jgi:hypothetical protein
MWKNLNSSLLIVASDSRALLTPACRVLLSVKRKSGERAYHLAAGQ